MELIIKQHQSYQKVKHIKEFNIGHFIIGESLTNGIEKVIKKFKKISKTIMQILGIGTLI